MESMQNLISSGFVYKTSRKDIDVLTKTHSLLSKLVKEGIVLGILRDIKNVHRSKLKSLPTNVALIHLKDDFKLVKNFFLTGLISPVSQEPF